MKRIYTHHNPMLVGIVRGKLELEGFHVELKNDLISGAAGELAPIDLWPELWLKDSQHLDRAMSIVAEFTQAHNDPQSMPPWLCKTCGESNDGNFELCWQCQDQPESGNVAPR